MNKIILITLYFISFIVIADDKNQWNSYPSYSYGSPQLYYSAESIHERREQELMKESNNIAKERLEVEREQLLEDKRDQSISGDR
ncbi:MAG: hypothetical protein WCG16_11420 [Methylococcales bacterium]